MLSENTYLKLHSSCIPVAGKVRSLICDLQRGKFNFIPNALFDLLQEFESTPIDMIRKRYNRKNKKTLDEYIKFLLKEEYVFRCSETELAWFPPMGNKYDNPYIIQNCIVDVDKYSNHNWAIIAQQLNELMCSDLQIRFFSEVSVQELARLLQFFESKMIKNIEVLMPYSSHYENSGFYQLVDSNNRLFSVIVHSNSENRVCYSPLGKTVLFTIQVITDNSHCGIIDPSLFVINKPAFFEGLKYNTCLNKKISIDVNGDIRNCPSMPQKFENLHDTTLRQAIEKKLFKKLWNISKDKINTCKNCEFRYICTDCRAYIQEPKDVYSKPLKCGYDPNTGKWEKWSANPLSKRAILHYKLNDLNTTH